MKKMSVIFITMCLIFSSITSSAVTKKQDDGVVLSKDEVIYGKLHANGTQKEMYVVNSFDVVQAGKIVDYGTYSNIKNLTDLSEITTENEKHEMIAAKGKFHYQGTMANPPLPWDFSITYYLDGKKLSPKELAGKSGYLKIKINSSANKNVNKTFFENYVLQISLPFHMDRTNRLKAEKGTIANAGEDKQVTFTVLPEKEEELIVEANVEEFEFAGMDISAIPFSMFMEEPDVDEMKGNMQTLKGAIRDIHAGVTSLRNGISQLNDGANELKVGSAQFKKGLNEVSSGIVEASEQMEEAFQLMDEVLGDAGEIDFSELEFLLQELSFLPDELKEVTSDLKTVNKNFKNANRDLNKAMNAIPSYTISQKAIDELYESDANKETIDQLVETYHAAQAAKKTHANVKKHFDEVDLVLTSLVVTLDEIVDLVDVISTDFESMSDYGQLKGDIRQLTSNYEQFHDGLTELTTGVSQLARSYDELHNGIVGLSTGTNELYRGATELQEGTGKLQKSTSNLPEKLTEEIDKMLAEYDKSDFEPISFVSEKNEQVATVQFVLKTEKIKQNEAETKEEQKEEKSWWQRFKDLFKKK